MTLFSKGTTINLHIGEAGSMQVGKIDATSCIQGTAQIRDLTQSYNARHPADWCLHRTTEVAALLHDD